MSSSADPVWQGCCHSVILRFKASFDWFMNTTEKWNCAIFNEGPSGINGNLIPGKNLKIADVDMMPFLTFARVWGGGHFGHTTWFFVNGGKTTARSAAVFFLHSFSYMIFAPFQKISAQGHLRSGHQFRSSDPISKIIYDCAVTTVVKVSI